jgi:hypothetical protein
MISGLDLPSGIERSARARVLLINYVPDYRHLGRVRRKNNERNHVVQEVMLSTG